MRLFIWNCAMAFHRKVEAVLDLKPDIAVICECAEPDLLRDKSETDWVPEKPVWIGSNRHKGLGVFAFNRFEAQLSEPYFQSLRHIAPVRICGPLRFNLLAAWAQNASDGVIRKHQSGPLRRSLNRYRTFLQEAPSVVAGDLNSNAIWDRPGWRINHMSLVASLRKFGLVSAYHEMTGELHGAERTPTHYWRDRRKDGPTYHLDYAFLPRNWMGSVTGFQVGRFEDWVGTGFSDHVPILIDIDP